MQSIIDRRDRSLGITRLVRILDAKDESAPMMSREKPVEERSPRATDVQIAGGRWSKANADEFMRNAS